MLGSWWKFTSNQLHNVGKTQAQSAKTFKKGFRGFLYSSNTVVTVLFTSQSIGNQHVDESVHLSLRLLRIHIIR